MKSIKKSILAAIIVLFSFNCMAQLSVSNMGSVTINANIQDWHSGIKVIVPTTKSCAYHLTYNNKDRFYVCAEGWLWCEKGGWFGSDLKLKKNINIINSPLSTVLLLKGVQFNYKEDSSSIGQRIGFIAQEVEKILPGVVKTMPDSTKAIAYTDLIALLVEAIKEQQTLLEKLQKEIEFINSKNIEISNKNSKTNLSNQLMTIEYSKLEQNSPNPFNIDTKINYNIAEDANVSILYIYNMSGSPIKKIKINQKGEGYVIIKASELKPGMYLYSLIVDNKEIDTKRMIITD